MQQQAKQQAQAQLRYKDIVYQFVKFALFIYSMLEECFVSWRPSGRQLICNNRPNNRLRHSLGIKI